MGNLARMNNNRELYNQKLSALSWIDVTEFTSIACEETFLARLMMLHNAKMADIQESMLLVDEKCFTESTRRKIFSTIKQLFTTNECFDAIAVVGMLHPTLEAYVFQIINDIVPSSNIISYAKQLVDYRILRDQVELLVRTIQQVNNHATPTEAIEGIRENLTGINNTHQTKLSKIVEEFEELADDYLSSEDDSLLKIHTDIPGLPPVPSSALITIAGRPSVGKSFFGLYFMDKLMCKLPNKRGLYFNLEMHPVVMMQRYAGLLGHIEIDTKERIKNSIHLLMAKNIGLINRPMITIDEIETISRLQALKCPIGAIVVDYMGLVRAKARFESKHLEQENIAYRLAALSLELNCTVIALSQVNRDYKLRPIGDRCPNTQDASGSMGTVHSSTWWIGIDRPEIDTDDSQYQYLFMIQNRKARDDSGFFSINLDFKNGQFFKRQRPFCSKYKSNPQEIEL